MLYSIFTQNVGADPIWQKTVFKPPAKRWRCLKMILLVWFGKKMRWYPKQPVGTRVKTALPWAHVQIPNSGIFTDLLLLHPLRHLENDPWLYNFAAVKFRCLLWFRMFVSKSLESHVIPICFSTCFCYVIKCFNDQEHRKILECQWECWWHLRVVWCATKVHGVDGLFFRRWDVGMLTARVGWKKNGRITLPKTNVAPKNGGFQ